MKRTLNSLSIASILGICLLHSIAYADFDKGVVAYENKDYPTAFKEFTESANKGIAEAQFNLGLMYGNGKGVPKNAKEAVKWFQLAADQGFAIAQSSLGSMYYRGDGIPKNAQEAIKWFQLAADQGHASAQFSLGVMYANGEGVPKNAKEAVKWYRLAADQGHASAQSNLAYMYIKGKGVEINLVLAYALVNLAAAQQDDTGLKMNRDLIERQLTPKQLEEAQAISSEWQVGTPFPTQTKKYHKKK